MRIMFMLIMISLVVAVGFLLAFLWATRNGQFDDDYTPSVRMLFDDAAPAANEIDKAQEPEKAVEQTFAKPQKVS